MREITTLGVLVIFYLAGEFSSSFARDYEACDLIAEFIEKYNLPLEDSIGMTCVASTVSELKTTHAQTDISTNRRVFGMFGISEGNACKFGSPGFCQVTCDKFLDNDITDDLECLQKILEYTPRRPKAFTDCEEYDWKSFMDTCSSAIKGVVKRDALQSKYFKLHDFEVVKRSLEQELEEHAPQTRISRPGPPADLESIQRSFERHMMENSSEGPNLNEYITDEPPRPFSNPRSSNKQKQRQNGSKNGARKQRRKKPKKINLNSPMSVVIKTPIIPREFHVIPGPSVSVPLSSLGGQAIPDVPIEPPPSLNRVPSINTASREYLPPFASQAGADGRSKKYDIKLDRPVSQITVHVTYA